MVPFLIFLVILNWSLLVGLLSNWRRNQKLLLDARSAAQVRAVHEQTNWKRPMKI